MILKYSFKSIKMMSSRIRENGLELLILFRDKFIFLKKRK